MLYGCIEGGGTKMVLAVMDEERAVLDRAVLPTRAPEETLPEMLAFFRGRDIAGLGIAFFGPLGLRKGGDGYGHVLVTPKPGWRDADVLGCFSEGLGVPCLLDTDVNAAALGEYRYGAARGTDVSVYVTVGTGVGGGVVAGGRPVHGGMHPEWGHIPLRVHPDDPMPQGVCPFHRGCLEGLASGPSIQKRWGVSAADLPEGHIAWEIESDYLAQMCAHALMLLSAERIVIGGGVLHRASLYPMIREKTREYLGGYLCSENALDLDKTIVPPELFPLSGLYGAYILARAAAEEKRN